MASEDILPQHESCPGATPGDQLCTERIVDRHFKKTTGCQGMVVGECLSSHKNHPQANMETAAACKADSATALCRSAYLKRKKDPESVGSTGEGLGHLSDAHAVGRDISPGVVAPAPTA